MKPSLSILSWIGPAARLAIQARGIALLVLAAALFTLSGCMGSFSKSTPPEYYQIDYSFEPSVCEKPFSGAVRVWTFTASTPFDREQMTVVSSLQSVRFSSTYKWVSPPGNMLADKLMRDLSLGSVFQDAVPVGNPLFAAYEISGQIYKFALDENGSLPRASLEVEISLWQEKPVRSVLFRKHFHYQSPPLPSPDPQEFAKTMSELVSRLSQDLRNDLCAISQDSSHRAGG
ncbi:MAG: PqiC family protein [Desulfobacteraceae bacterium]|nr:PqiC family protein [Desulfobacteraceae bacterium]